MRQRIHENDAERQRAYRQRLKERLAGHQTAPAPTRTRRTGRPRRLAIVVAELRALAAEYEGWLQALPPGREDGEQAEQLHETLEVFEDVVEKLETLRLPRGYGRS